MKALGRWHCVNLIALRPEPRLNKDGEALPPECFEELENIHVWTPVGKMPGLSSELSITPEPGDIVHFGGCLEHTGKRFRLPKDARTAINPG